MLGRMAGPGGGGVSEQRQREAAFDFGRHTDTTAVPSSPPPHMVPSKLFLAAGSGVISGEEALAFSPPAELAGAAILMVSVSPTSTLQAPTSSPTSAAATAVPFSHHGATSSSTTSSGGDDHRQCKSRSRSQQRPWEARPVGVGLAGALNSDADALPPAATVLMTGQRIRPCRSSASSTLGSTESRSRCILSPWETMEASEGYTRIIARGPNPRTTHIFDDRVVVVVEDDSILRCCHGCSKDLGQGNDIFMYRSSVLSLVLV